ncbi:MAG: hypothetical protein COX70_05080 [Flavobacteriales bacterium CG_4_10_14_0_2_um_filter_32_8]|nr:MAG: hypothetical protein COX70_05080 [Flavobacteriales bacterium CG_4_10_14_0_2_um_filter_32_8]
MTNDKKSSKKPKPLKNFARFSGIAAQMGITIFLGAYLGKWLDHQYPSTKNWFTIGLTILSVCLSLFVVLRQLKNNEEE